MKGRGLKGDGEMPDAVNQAQPPETQDVVVSNPAGVRRVLHLPSHKEPPVIAARPLSAPKLYQDEVYGTKELSPLAVAIIDTPEFQRLSTVYQLGLAYTVFRGATHPRFDHCIGAHFMCRLLLRRVVQNHGRFYGMAEDGSGHPGNWLSPRLYEYAPGVPASRQAAYSAMGCWRGVTEVCSAAALLHDISHVAVGHTLEDEFSVYEKHDSIGNSRLFQLLYGPRLAKEVVGDAITTVERFFSPIDVSALPHPTEITYRVPLPWLFESGVYAPFLGEPAGAVPPLGNADLRDLIYLILSFREKINKDTYKTFGDILAEAMAAAEVFLRDAATDEEKQYHLAARRRVEFIQYLYKSFSARQRFNESLAEAPLFHPFMADVVSNTICADLLDYLVRDGRRLKLDIRDNPRLQRYLVIRPETSLVGRDRRSGDLRLTINAVHRGGLPRRDTISDLLDLMRERYRFSETVYYHPKKAAFSAMLAKALELAGPTAPKDDNVYPAPWANGRRRETPHIVHFGDAQLVQHLSHSSNPEASDLARRILYRDEYRLLFTLDHDTADHAGGPGKFIRELRLATDHRNKDEGRQTMEKLLAEVIVRAERMPANVTCPVLMYCPFQRMQAKEVAARVELATDRVIPLNRQERDAMLRDEIELLNSKYRRLWRLYVFVHPALVVPHEQHDFFLSTLVDVFCDHFGVPLDRRARGFRYHYVPFGDRVTEELEKWRSRLGHNFDDAPFTKIRGFAKNVDLWESTAENGAAIYPLTEQDYAIGFTLGGLLAAAAATSEEDRASWPEALRSGNCRQWLRHSPIPATDAARKRAVSGLKSVAVNFARGLANRPKTWADIVAWAARQLSDAT